MACLYAAYGRPDLTQAQEQGGDELLSTLIATVLSQATTHTNAARALDGLLTRFEGDWEAIHHAPPDQVALAIRPGGLARQKTKSIQAILAAVKEQRAAYDLEFLRHEPAPIALKALRAMPGVGPKTARYVLMHAARMPLFAMDTHILRICKRLGLIPSRISDEQAHALMEAIMPPGEHEAAHLVLIEHGRRRCLAQRPACAGCPLLASCAWAKTQAQALSVPG